MSRFNMLGILNCHMTSLQLRCDEVVQHASAFSSCVTASWQESCHWNDLDLTGSCGSSAAGHLERFRIKRQSATSAQRGTRCYFPARRRLTDKKPGNAQLARRAGRACRTANAPRLDTAVSAH